MSEYAIKPLDATTWDAYGRLLDKHNGVGSAVAGARGSIRERAGRRAKKAAPGRSVSFVRATLTRPWSSTPTPRWRGASSALRTSFRT